MSLSKLIQQYERETGQKAETNIVYCMRNEDGEPDLAIKTIYTNQFVEWLAELAIKNNQLPPCDCGKYQRT